ncbi:NAD(P)H-hydrate dehydratase [Variibacter gotjawalensis]|uniref:NAD(P)H-hydrate dehydratase n=1 Tax=Variibacter gotjawalensis TaxID=1333996 RepID=UPI000BBA8A05|nr:NAD(P)H-hydrate dehydratase [Variibacter gotjawalensis]
MELLTTAEMNSADRAAISAGTPGIDLMEAAGAAVAEAAEALVPSGSIAIVCGPGNNGGDGFVAARLLAERGRSVRVFLVGERNRLKGDAADAAKRWSRDVLTPDAIDFSGDALVIDALFGAGLARPVDGAARRTIQAMNTSGAKVLSVDLPSGISGDSGAELGVAVKATASVTFFRLKPGHLLFPGRVHCGAVTCTDIGIPATVLSEIKPRTFHNFPALWARDFPMPRLDGHKYARGHVAVHSGGLTSTGASRLAARSALRTGAGLVSIASPTDALVVHTASNLAVMVREVPNAETFRAMLSDRRFTAAVVGPGGGVGQAMRQMVRAAAQSHVAMVLDADALTSFVNNLPGLTSTIRKSRTAVLTPHEGEFARLFGEMPGSKPDRAREAARQSGAVVVLKGPDTVIAAPDGRAAINDNAPPWLATAGSGDVLAGTVAGLLAQSMPGFEAACAAVWLHGEAANAFGVGLIADDISDVYPSILKRFVGTGRL